MRRKSTIPFILGIFLLSLLLARPNTTEAYESRQRPNFPAVLSGDRIRFSPPTLADLDSNGRLTIIVGGVDGMVYAVRPDGSLRWSFNISTAINEAARNVPGLRASTNAVPIRSAAAVADVTGDGIPEVIVTGGDIFDNPTHGGIVVLSRDGRLMPGWPQFARDFSGPQLTGPDGYADGIATSPAVADIDKDGRAEIVYGAFDQMIYVRHGDGSMQPNWPQFVLDTVWSSPALADLNGDGFLDIIEGVDSHYYRGDPRPSEDGGDLYVFNYDGTLQWRVNQDEIIESSPAVADVDNDGKNEVFIGTGEYRSISEGKPFGRYFTAYNYNGSYRWRQNLPAQVLGSPAIGDINGDGRLEVVVGVVNGEVYAFDAASGSILWHTLARDIFNNFYLPDPEVTSPMLGDYDGDGIDDVFIALAWDVVVMKGSTGEQLTATSPEDRNKPSFYGSYSITLPAIGDIDNNGKLDVISASGNHPSSSVARAQINAWELPNSTAKASWPVFRGNPAHTGYLATPKLSPSIPDISRLTVGGVRKSFPITFQANWTVTESDGQNIVSLNRTSGSRDDTLVVTLSSPRNVGTYTATLTVRSPGAAPVTIPITIRVVPRLTYTYLPLTIR